MPFSEGDIDPYKKTNGKLTAESLKTALMQWSLLDTDIQELAGFVTDIDPAKLASMASFDLEADVGSDSGNFLCAVPNFSSIFDQALEDNATEDVRREERRAELKPAIMALYLSRNAPIRAQVEKCLDDELKPLGVPETTLTKMSLRAKATQLAEFRMRQKFTVTKPDDYFTNATKYTFVAYLNILNGGHGGSIRTTRLTFPFNTPFHRFERILQDETQLCIIAPDDHPPTTSSGQTASDASIYDLGASPLLATDPLDLSSNPSTLSANIYTAYGHEWETCEEHGTTWVKSPLPPTRKEKGYTARDGPWHCRISSLKARREKLEESETIYHVGDDESYRKLVLKVQSLAENEPDNDFVVQIMHSKEKRLYEEITEQREQLQHDAAGGNEDEGEDDDDHFSGETYFEWFCRTNG